MAQTDLTPDLAKLPMLERCIDLSLRPTLSIGQIRKAVDQGGFCAKHLAELVRPDPTHPYGRRVLIETGVLESMIASWTRGVHCAPHDHGGSRGCVRVIRGAARHRVYKVVDGELTVIREERVEAGAVMPVGPDIIHSMGDDGDEEALVTLHLYTDPIDHMIVYDLETNRTLVVDGGCGAWVPHDAPELIRETHEGIQRYQSLGVREKQSA